MTQTAAILARLRSGAVLTPLDALQQMGVFRLAARSDELRHAGFDIETKIVRAGRKHWAEYRMRPAQRELFQELRA
jgi:hypothetical protein